MEELKTAEKEIVRRINSFPNGGQLLLTDALRLFRDINVQISGDVIKSWNKLTGGAFDPTGKESAYDDLHKSHPGDRNINIMVHQLLKETYTPAI
jgi:hypothetical protein